MAFVMMTRGASGFDLKSPSGCPAFDDERLVAGEDFEVLFYQAVLHPVLAHLSRFTIGDEFVGIEGDVETEVVVDHHLKGLALDAACLCIRQWALP